MDAPDRTIAALDDLQQALREVADNVDGLIARCKTLADELRAGTTLDEAMAVEPRPLIITQMTALLDMLTQAGTEVRRAEALQLREEGYTHHRIAETFGVSRQRASMLLKPKTSRPFRPVSAEKRASRKRRST